MLLTLVVKCTRVIGRLPDASGHVLASPMLETADCDFDGPAIVACLPCHLRDWKLETEGLSGICLCSTRGSV